LLTPEERFHDCYIVNENGCWIWQKSTKRTGDGVRGQFWLNRKNLFAHRAAWLLFWGPIPDGLLICHECDVGICVNPDHLFLGTHKDNTKDMIQKGRANPRRGEECHYAKLTANDVIAIRRSKETGVALSKLYGVGEMEISRIKRNLRWRHIHA